MKVTQQRYQRQEQEATELLQNLVWTTLLAYLGYKVLMAAYNIRLGAINQFGPVIHEFDPYFNYRATE